MSDTLNLLNSHVIPFQRYSGYSPESDILRLYSSLGNNIGPFLALDSLSTLLVITSPTIRPAGTVS